MIVLAIDPGRTSGWALVDGSHVLDAGTTTSAKGRREVVTKAIGHAPDRLLVVGERWTGNFIDERSSTRTIAGIGASWGRWAEQLELAGHPKYRTFRVAVNDWRRAILRGKTRRTTDEWKSAAHAECMMRWPGFRHVWTASPDACEAACIGLYAAHAPKIREAAPKKARA